MKLYYIVTSHFYDLFGDGPKTPNYVGRVVSFREYGRATEYLKKLQICYPTMNFWIVEENVLVLR
jgi:hypothetical protein